MEKAFAIVEPEQQRSGETTTGLVTKTAHDTVSRTQALHLKHGARAREIVKIQMLGYSNGNSCAGRVRSAARQKRSEEKRSDTLVAEPNEFGGVAVDVRLNRRRAEEGRSHLHNCRLNRRP